MAAARNGAARYSDCVCRSRWLPLVAVAVVLALAPTVRGQNASPPPLPSPLPTDPLARIAELEKEVDALEAQLKGSGPAPTPSATSPTEIEKIIDRRLKEKLAEDEAKKKAEAEQKAAEGTIVVDDKKLIPTWDWGGFRFKSADEAFSLHLGGRLMSDAAWWSESPGLRKPSAFAPGSPWSNFTGVGPGVGDLQDGFYLRRSRLVADGTIYQTVEFKMEVDFENYNSLLFDESYVGIKDLPFVDAVRLGQTHVPFGLEAYTSSRFLPMLERSPNFDAFYQEFAPGIFVNSTFLDQRITTQQMFHRIDYFNQFNGASFGDGKYAFTARVSGLPIYEDDGRYLLHLGIAYQFRNGSRPSDFNGGTTLGSLPDPVLTTNTDLVRFRSRAGVRDSVGLQGVSARVVDTGNIIADNVQAVNGEFLCYAGPAWAQCEWCVAQAVNAFYPASKNATGKKDLTFSGGYAEVGYFLTGENRGYDKRMGKYDRVIPNEPFFLVADEGGNPVFGLGAWEIVYRYGCVDLNDKTVLGGWYGEHTIGLNWYWNSNVKLQFNYFNGQRAVVAGATSGNVQGLGVRAALEF